MERHEILLPLFKMLTFMSDLVTPYFQPLAKYIGYGKEFSKAEFEKLIYSIEGIRDNVKRLVHSCVYSKVVKKDDGTIEVL